MFDWLRIAAVLSRARDLRLRDDPRCKVEKNVRAANGWLLDRYLPKSPSGGSLVLLHGWTMRGKDHTRLQVFAQALAVAGVACTVPHVPGLAALTFDPDDVRGVRAILDACPTSPGLLGFSLGGGYGLLAASGAQDRPRFVVSVGSYADLAESFRRAMAWGRRTPAVPTKHDAWVYQKLAVAWRLREVIPLSPPLQQELRGLLEAFCEGDNVEASWRFCQRALGDADWETVDENRQDAQAMAALSVVGNPPRLSCPAIILHGENDPSMPSDEAQRLADAVKRGSPDVRVDVMVTELLEHIRPSVAFHPGEVIRLLKLLSPLVRA
jgi:pimeloyl-ACP methyl ester carboxylesterase